MTRRILLLLLLAALVACAGPGPIVEYRTHGLPPGTLQKVAVVPFYPSPQLLRSAEPGGVTAAEAADLISRFMAEALENAGVAVVAPSDLIIAFEGDGRVLPRQDVASAALVAARDFGATAVLLGKVMRYRERVGAELGAQSPASVWFEVELHTAPAGTRVFSARFEQTQPTVTSNVLLVRKFPGRGSRWLSAGELSRWGAEEIVKTIPEQLR